MRATEIGIRSPKEFTPAPYLVPVTYDGRSLFVNKTSTKESFRRAERFNQYQQAAMNTGYRVGPGSYNVDQLAIGRLKAHKVPLYKPLYGVEKGKSYYMVSQNMVPYQQKQQLSHLDTPKNNRTRQFKIRRRTTEDYSRALSPYDDSPTRKNIRIKLRRNSGN